MAKRVDFERLRTMDDVHREQLRVRYDIKHCEHTLRRDTERVSELFTANYWLSILSVKASELVSEVTGRIAGRIRGIASGFGFVESLLAGLGRRNKPSRQPECECDYEEDDFYYIPDDGENDPDEQYNC